VLFFARARELAGQSRAQLLLPGGATVDAAVTELARSFPGLARFLPNCRFAVNEEFAAGKDRLPERCVLAVIPPVSGG